MIEQIDFLRHPCDLDLLVFFARRPLSVLAKEQLAILLGYEFTQIATSLALLQGAGLLIKSENPTYIAQKYVFTPGGDNVGWLSDLLHLASTRAGRLALLRALRESPAGDRWAVPRVERAPTAKPGPQPHPGPTRNAAPRPASKNRRKKRRMR